MAGTIGSIGGSGGSSAVSDHEFIELCDTALGVSTKFLRRYTVSPTGVLTFTDTTLDGTTAYTVSGTVGACQPVLENLTDECFIAITAGAGYASGDRIIRITTWDMSVNPPIFKSTVYRNQNAGTILGAAPISTHLRPCDVELSTITTCYKAITAGADWAIGDTLYRVSVTDYTNVGAGIASDLFYFNATQDTVISTTLPVITTDIIECGEPDKRLVVLCDDTGAFIRHIYTNASGGVTTADTSLDGTTAYVVTGTVKVCTPSDVEILTLCDDNGAFLRHVSRAPDGTITTFDSDLGGITAYTTAGTVKLCEAPIPDDIEVQVLCDGLNSFLRHIIRSAAGVVTVNDTTLDGVTAYVVTGVVGACSPASLDSQILCDDNGPFIRSTRTCQNCTPTLVDTALDGTTVYTPVGTVKLCVSPSEQYIPLCDTTTTAGTPATTTTINTTDIQDAEQKTNGGGVVIVNDNDIQFGLDAGNNDKIGAIRFLMNVPQGATITAASIQFTVDSVSVNPSNLTIQAEASDNAALFTTAVNSLAARAKTTSVINWSPPAWSTVGAAGAGQKTPDLTALVQEVVNRAGWVANNAIAFFLDGTGLRDAVGLATSAANAPKLTITYQTAAGTTGSTTVTRFWRKIVDGVDNGDFTIDNAGDWVAYTPTGTIAVCPEESSDFETLCLQDSTGTQFIRIIAVDKLTGNYTVVGNYNLDLSLAYTPVGATRDCEALTTKLDAEAFVLCDNNGAFMRHVVYSENGAVLNTYNTLLDGVTTYLTVGTVKVCGGSSFVTEQRVCSNNITLVRRGVINTSGVETFSFYGDNGAAVAAPATYTIGKCKQGTCLTCS